MPLSEDLLTPIPGPNPSGQNLRYVLYGPIKEARREDDEVPQGDWAYERKRADYPLVLRLCCDGLANQTKDIQLVVWATEAALKLEGLPGLQRGLDLLGKLVDQFWETLYPELEDGDAELRVGVLESLGGKFSSQLLYLSLTSDGLNWLQYKDSRTIGYETDAAGNEEKQQAREQAINDGKIPADAFDSSVAKTPKAFYESRLGEADDCLAALHALDDVCKARLGNAGPSFAGLRDGLEDFRQVVSILLRKKREEEPDGPSMFAADPSPMLAEQDQESYSAAPVAPSPASSISKEPQDAVDAVQRIVLAAHYLRRENPTSPIPYLVLRAVRWGELRTNLEDLDLSMLEAPTTEVRKQLRALMLNSEWEELLNAGELAMATPCGRGWLDLQRYVVTSCDSLGNSYSSVSDSIVSTLESLLSDYPQLAQISLNDETPTANPETQAWLQELKNSKSQPFAQEFAPVTSDEGPAAQLNRQPPDSYDLAKQAASSGHPQDAIAILEREAAQERSGRGRFQRRVQLAQVCMAAGYKGVALPILEALAREIDDRKLEDWEDPDLVIHALGLLYQCMDKLKASAEQKEKVYARICRLGPVQALELVK
jgi:type VI secretion system protein ImpA